jgi:hypothetical protein
MIACTLPPPGWSCSREPGHDGPCAARPIEDETGWMIERQIAGRAHWWTGAIGWSYDNQEGIRFARKLDAERVIAAHGLADSVALEHMWTSMARS